MNMKYVIYGVFIFWYLCALPPLVTLAQRIFWPEPDPELRLRPTWYYIGSAIFDITATTSLLWLYSSGYLDEWSTVIVGWLVFLPEVIYLVWSQGIFRNKESISSDPK